LAIIPFLNLYNKKKSNSSSNPSVRQTKIAIVNKIRNQKDNKKRVDTIVI